MKVLEIGDLGFVKIEDLRFVVSYGEFMVDAGINELLPQIKDQFHHILQSQFSFQPNCNFLLYNNLIFNFVLYNNLNFLTLTRQ